MVVVEEMREGRRKRDVMEKNRKGRNQKSEQGIQTDEDEAEKDVVEEMRESRRKREGMGKNRRRNEGNEQGIQMDKDKEVVEVMV